MSEGFEADPADQTIVQMVFCEETNQSDEVNNHPSHTSIATLHTSIHTPYSHPIFPPHIPPSR